MVHKKKEPSSGIRTTDVDLAGTYLLVHSISCIRRHMGMCLYLRIYAWKILTKKRKKHPSTRAWPRPTPESGEASKVKHDEKTAHRMVDLVSILFRALVLLPLCLPSSFCLSFCLTLIFIIWYFTAKSSFGFGSLFFVFYFSEFRLLRMHVVLVVPSPMAWHCGV